MNETFFTCPSCDFENVIHFDADGFDVQELWMDNDDSGLECVGCRKELNSDALYEAAQMRVAEEE